MRLTFSPSNERGEPALTSPRRARSKGVAILFTNREDSMIGEGLALGYLLMSMGAVTPERLEGVHAVFVHRNDSFAQLEPLYVELVNLPTHSVEYFRFGGGQPVEEIFSAGASLRSSRRASLELTRSDPSRRLPRHPDPHRPAPCRLVRALLLVGARRLRPHVPAVRPPCDHRVLALAVQVRLRSTLSLSISP